MWNKYSIPQSRNLHFHAQNDSNDKYLTNKPEVMANQYHASFEVIDSIS